jgi:hypothetical protein
VLGILGFIVLMITAFNQALRRPAPTSQPSEAAHDASVPPTDAKLAPLEVAPSEKGPPSSEPVYETSPDANLQSPRETAHGNDSKKSAAPPTAVSGSSPPKKPPLGPKPHPHKTIDVPPTVQRSRCESTVGDKFPVSLNLSGLTIEQRAELIKKNLCDGDSAMTQLCCVPPGSPEP